MFRKNFSGEKTVSSSGGGGKARGALGAGRNAKRRDRERYSCMEEHHYKTHIFFSAAPRASAQYNDLTGKRTCPVTVNHYLRRTISCVCLNFLNNFSSLSADSVQGNRVQ